MTNFYENFNVYSPNRGIIFKLLIIEIEKKNVENIVFRFEFINHCDELVFFLKNEMKMFFQSLRQNVVSADESGTASATRNHRK